MQACLPQNISTFLNQIRKSMHSNMHSDLWNAIGLRVSKLDTRTENPCVGGSIPPLGTMV